MRMRIRPQTCIALIACAALAPAGAWAKCQIRAVDIPVVMSQYRPLVTAKINGADATFVVDSGAFYSMITPAAADELKLARRRAPDGLRVYGVTGGVQVYVTRVESFALKKSTIPNVEFLVGGNVVHPDAVGLLGQNFLSASDVEYDLANGVIRLVYPADDCRNANLAYWAGTQPVVAIELDTGRNTAMKTMSTATANGVKMRVQFDTGAPTSFLSLGAAERAGVVPGGKDVVAAEVSHGIGRGEIKTWIAPVREFAIGGERIENTHLRIGEAELDPADMIIGVDFLLSHHVYVANSQGRIYLTYNGGPVFNLGLQAGAAPAANAAAPAGTIADAGSSPPADAGGFARRGAAHAARREFPQALADFTQAIERDPQVGAYFLERARVQSALEKPDLALLDLNEAVRLSPDDAAARMLRATARISGKDRAGAEADLAVADHAAPRQADSRRNMGLLYLRLDEPAQAIAQFDAWIEAHDDDVNVPVVRNDRCWARALLGTELDKALADCNAAVKFRPDSAPFLDSRGLVHLRRGELDGALADYDASLRIDGRSAWSLYGRGLVRQRKGAAQAAAADFTAAGLLRPSIADEARRYGLAPQ